LGGQVSDQDLNKLLLMDMVWGVKLKGKTKVCITFVYISLLFLVWNNSRVNEANHDLVSTAMKAIEKTAQNPLLKSCFKTTNTNWKVFITTLRLKLRINRRSRRG
jgi:hypothetical protein